MFYSLSLLSRKGSLGTIWIAAYCFKKLKRGQIASTDISSTVDKIMPEIQISHRVLAQLLLGIVKIFSKKVDFLYDECNEALHQMRKCLPPTQRIAQLKARARPRKGIRSCEDVASSIDQAAKTMKEHSTEKLIETMLASYHEVTVNLPGRFELDSFDLGILDDGDNGGSHQPSTPLDDWSGKRSKSSYSHECLNSEVVSLSDYKSSCFTPLADVLPSGMMDVDLELSEAHDNSSNFNSVQRSLGINITSMMDVDVECSETRNSSNSASDRKSQEECHDGGDLERRVCLSGIVHLHDVVMESHIPLNHEQREQSVGDQNPPVEEQRNLTVAVNLQEEFTSEIGKDNSISEEEHADASPSDKQKIKISETISPTFMLATPAIQESSRVLRKRKRKYNESIILSNKFMSQSIHDASDLVCKRRKLPQTDLDIWKLWRFSKHCQNFTDSLIPFSCPALEKLPQKKLSQLSNKSAVELIESTNVKDGMPENSSRDEIAEHSVQNPDEMSHYPPKESVVDHFNMEDTMPHINIETETETEVLMPKPDRTCPTPSKPSDGRANSTENVSKEFTSPDASDYQFEIMELCFHGDDIVEQANGWSPSTRAVAQYLCNRFLMLREQKQDADLSLAQILEGKTRATCARFIYEILTLKTYGCIDVRQDCPYGDASVSATPVLESFHKVSM